MEKFEDDEEAKTWVAFKATFHPERPHWYQPTNWQLDEYYIDSSEAIERVSERIRLRVV